MRRPDARAAALLLGAGLGLVLSGCPETVDFETGRFYVCSRDAGAEQCSTGWRCGLEGYCHPATGAAWLCDADSDCDGVWRCGADGTCVDPTADALLARAWPAPVVEPVSPRFVTSKIDLAAASSMGSLIDRCDFESPPFTFPFCGAPLDQSISFASSGTLVQAMRLDNSLARYDPPFADLGDYPLPDGGPAPREATTWAALPFQPASIAVSAFQTFVLDPGGRLYLMDASLDGGQSTVRRAPFDLPAPFAPNALKVERGSFAPNSPLLFAYERGGTRMATYSLEDGGTSGVLHLPLALTGGAILDLEVWDSPASLILTTEAGVFVADRYSDGFNYLDGGMDPLVPEFLELPVLHAILENGGLVTLQDAGFKPVRVWAYNRPFNSIDYYSYILVETVRGSGASAVHRVSEGGWDYNPDIPSGYQVDPPLDAIECDPGDVVAAVDVHDFGVDEELDVVCHQPGGNRPDVLKHVRGVSGCRLGCEVPQVFDDAGVGLRMIASGHFRTGTSDAHGRILFDEFGVGVNTLTLDSAPVAVVGGKGSLEAWTASKRLSPAATTEHFVIGGAGLVQATGQEWYRPPSVGGVRGASPWRIEDGTPTPVVTAPMDGGRGTLFTLPPLSDLRTGPFEGEVRVVDGKVGVVVSAFDSILSGQLGRDSQLQIRVVPNPRAAITSFDLGVSVPDSGTLLDGYAIAQGRLFRVTAETGTRWLSSEVAFNVRGEPRKVWLDQGRGRVAFSDGRIFSLPSRVLLAPQLPDFPPEAADFGFTCGHAFALGRRGLWRLDTAGGGKLGAWTPVDLDPVVAGAAAEPGWAGGRLHAVDEPSERALYVFTEHGNVTRIAFDPASCP